MRRRGPVTTAEPRPPGTGARAWLAGAALAGVWAAAFRWTGLPFFPLIAVGGVLTGMLGLWVRAGTGVGGDRERLPALAPPSGAALALAAGVAGAHLVAAHLLFAAGSRLLPWLAPTAEEVYGRGGDAPLWWAVLLAGVVTAPLEEVFWRGAVHPLLARATRRRGALPTRIPGGTVLLSALLYAGFHLTTGHLALVAAALLGGLVWGWLTERTGSVAAAMLAHGLWAVGMLVAPPV